MKFRNLSAGVASLIFASVCVSGFAAPKKHHHPASVDAAPHKTHKKSAAHAEHLARLAAKQKAAWHAHLAKVRALPRSERLALKRHNRRLQELAQQTAAERKHAAKLAARQTKRSHTKQASSPTSGHAKRLAAIQARQHNQRLAAIQAKQHAQRLAAQRRARLANVPSKHAQRVAALQIAHERNVRAAQSAHERKVQAALAAHNRRLAAQQAAHNARLRARQQLMAQRALANSARHAKLLAEHNARVAAQRSHWVALHGDGSSGHSIKFWETMAAGTPVKVISVDLNDTNVKVSAVMARKGSGTSEPFRQMIQRADPNVAVTGTFFSLDNLQPVGDIVIDGSLVHFGGMGTALCITPDNQARMVTCTWGRHHDWSDFDFVCACGPRLLQNGRVVLDPRAERFHDRHMLAPNSRIAVGITRSNKIVFAMTHKAIYLGRLAKVMKSLGAVEAMNLDAGTSTGFYYNGATLAAPGRKLTNMIVVYGRKERYERALDQLVPATYRRMDRGSHRQVSQLPK